MNTMGSDPMATKNRNGEIGEVRVNFIREFTRFEDRPLPLKEGDGYTSEPPPQRPEFAQDTFS